MLKDIIDAIQNKIDIKKQENNHYNELLNKTTTFKNLFPIPQNTIQPSEYKITSIINDCPDLNEKKATIITTLIPINESYLTTIYSKEVITNQEYFLVATNQYLWIINTQHFGAIPYQNISCTIIKNNLMSKTLLLNNILIEANGNNSKIENFINILTDQNYRHKKINEKTAYLCNIIPIYQQINAIGSGISCDAQNNIVFHTKERNYKYNIHQIKNYEILLDNKVYISKNSQKSTSIGSFHNSCYQISVRITTEDNQILILPILEQSSFGNKYTAQDTIFQKNLNFATTIINKLNELSPKY